MSILFLRAFFTKALLFFIVFLILVPLTSLGSLTEEEEPRTHIQTITKALKKDLLDIMMIYPEGNNIPDALSRVTAHLVTFMREQLFTVSPEKRGSRSNVSITPAPLEHRHTESKQVAANMFPPSLTIYDYVARVKSPAFEETAEYASYTSLLEEWAKKVSLKMHYTPLLPERHLRNGMLIFCLHPQDVSPARAFLGILYDALKHLRELNQSPLIPDHNGLKSVFSLFEAHRNNKDEVLRLWGEPLLAEIEQFHREQNIVFKWDIAARAFTAAKEASENSLQAARDQMKRALEEINTVETTYGFGKQYKLKRLIHLSHYTEQGMQHAFQTWKNSALFYMGNYFATQPYDPSRNLKYAELALNVTIESAKEAFRHFYQLKEESDKVKKALAIAQYFSEHPGIQFANPFQTKRDLFPLHLKYTDITRISDLLNIAPLYTFFGELLTFTLRQIQESAQSPAILAKRLPPLALVPEGHKEETAMAYRNEKGISAGVDAFEIEARRAQKALNSFKRSVRRNAIGLYPREKEELSLLLNTLQERKLTGKEERRLEDLLEIVMENGFTGANVPREELDLLLKRFFERELEPVEHSRLAQLIKIIMENAFKRIDTAEKTSFYELKSQAQTRELNPGERERLAQLRESIFEKELALSEPYIRAQYLEKQNTLSRAEAASKVFELKHRRALLNLNHVQVMFLLHMLEFEIEETKAPFRQQLSDLEAEVRQVEKAIKDLQTEGAHKFREYEAQIKKIKQEYEAGRNLQMQAGEILSLNNSQRPLIPFPILEAILLEALRTHIEIPVLNIQQEANDAFRAEHEKTLASLRAVIANIENKSSIAPVARTRIIQLAQAHVKTVEAATLEPTVIAALETVPLFLRSAVAYHRISNQPIESALRMLRLVRTSYKPEKQAGNSQAMSNTGREVAKHLTGMSESQLFSSGKLTSAASSEDVPLPTIAQQWEESFQASENLLNIVVTTILRKLNVLSAN